jgi:hypothetical protein
MQKYQSTTPDWLYCEPAVDFSNNREIKKELVLLHGRNKKEYLTDFSSTFGQLDRNLAIAQCPTLCAELKKLDILKCLLGVVYVSIVHDKEWAIHCDVITDIGLNIPLINCHDTYTVWYDTEILDQRLPEYSVGTSLARTGRICNVENAKEIGRCNANKSYWINTNVPHRPETHHDKFRLAASLRFDPEPLDEKGQLFPHLIKC